jgi:cation diffusion facilitator family transporter
MHIYDVSKLKHEHQFHLEGQKEAERRTYYVIGLTLTMMVVEIAGGTIFGSMALLADGWHMGTHAAALGITAFAYAYARRHADNPSYTFGTGKVGVLGGYTSAVVLGVIALMMLWESGRRLVSPVPIRFNEAILVACLGLVVNLLSAYLLMGSRHRHGERDEHEHDHNHHQDHNIRAAYLHVIADALTSVLAIIALTTGRFFGWVWMDPIMGIVGALIISRWSYGLLRDSSKVLLDGEARAGITASIRETLESEGDNRVSDLHVWRVGAHDFAAIITLLTHDPKPPDHYKSLLSKYSELSHVTVEVHGYPGESCLKDNEEVHDEKRK